MKKIRVAVNGFGRIGRTFTRILLRDSRFEIIAINDLAEVEVMAHLFRYDSIHGRWDGTVKAGAGKITINDQSISYSTIPDALQLPWAGSDIDVVVECTGTMKHRMEIEKHITAGAKRVLLSAPPDDDSITTVVFGVNDHLVTKSENILSNASCTTNNAAPLIMLIDELWGIEGCYITTVHSYTGDQRLHDAPHKDLRRSRAAAQSIIPTTTGAAKALTRIFPHLSEQMGGCGIRVPVPDGSLTDITCTVRKIPSIEEVNRAFHHAATGRWNGIMEYTSDPVVSVDILGNTHSCVFDSQLTSVIGNMVKVVGWYDNETGYSNRLSDLLLKWLG